MDSATAAAVAAAKLAPIRGRHRLALIVDLASDEQTHRELAVKYGRHVSAIDQFSVRNHQEILDTRRQIQDQAQAELVGLWMVIKQNRWSLYQEWLDDLELIIADPGATAQMKIKAIREGRSILRELAEEFGQLKVKLDIDRPIIRYVIKVSTPGTPSWIKMI
jgi:flagellar biosynthesis chaperone FliJ